MNENVFRAFLFVSFAKMMKKIEALMNPKEDSVRVYGMSRQVQKQVKIIGSPGILADPNYFFINDSEAPAVGTIIEIEDDGELPEWL